MTQLLREYVLNRSCTELVLLPSKLVWWPEKRTVLMADSHFGKASTFRKAGIAVPEGTTSKMLRVLTTHIRALEAVSLVVLGDLLHSSVDAHQDFESELANWRSENEDLKLVLVKGNHDRRSDGFYKRFKIETTDTKIVLFGPFELCHDPKDASGTRFGLCGHIHPAIQVKNLKLQCFWLRENLLVLPAFGEFTGTAKIKLAEQETAIAICEDHLAVIPAMGNQQNNSLPRPELPSTKKT